MNTVSRVASASSGSAQGPQVKASFQFEPDTEISDKAINKLGLKPVADYTQGITRQFELKTKGSKIRVSQLNDKGEKLLSSLGNTIIVNEFNHSQAERIATNDMRVEITLHPRTKEFSNKDGDVLVEILK